jgi:hypothetical protein
MDNHQQEIRPILKPEMTAVAGGMMKLPGAPGLPAAQPGEGCTWASSVTDLPASQGVGIVIHF